MILFELIVNNGLLTICERKHIINTCVIKNSNNDVDNVCNSLATLSW